MGALDLSPQDEAAVAKVLSRYPATARGPLNVGRLMDQWTRVVERSEGEYDRSLDDYANDVSARDVLEEVLGALPGPSRARLERVLRPLDSRFAAATEEAAFLRGEHWWANRLPAKMGDQMRKQADELKQQRHS